MAVGNATLALGAWPGTPEGSVAVTGQTGIVAGSKVEAFLRVVDSADHSADEHRVEPLRIAAGDIVAGTGFTIYGMATLGDLAWGDWSVDWVWA